MEKNSLPTKVDKKDLFYVQQTAKMSSGVVDIENLRIDIEEGKEPDISDLHLKNKFGFVIQFVVPGSISPPRHFEAQFRERKKPEEPEPEIDEIEEKLKFVTWKNMHTKSKFKYASKEGKYYVFNYVSVGNNSVLKLEKKDVEYNIKTNWVKV